MTGTVQLREGDMFAQPTDLIIIPCSTAGTVTRMVAERLRAFNIVEPRKLMDLGDVEFHFFEGATNIAAYVGYAASVEAMESSVPAISRIAEQIALFVRDKAEIRNIAIPLLGSGAGGLAPEDSVEALIEGLDRARVNNKVFNIFVFDQKDFRRLTAKSVGPISEHRISTPGMVGTLGANPNKAREAVRVFISYTKTNPEHQEWVRDLAIFLRENGVDARLDVWHLRRGMDLPQWMSNEIEMADRILIVCNEEYADRADGRLGGWGGRLS
jgi:hypothetical protein